MLLGGIACALDLPPAIAAPLAERYRGYETSDPVEIDCTVRVEPGFRGRGDDARYPIATVGAEGALYRFSRRDFEARFDLDSGRLEVVASSESLAVESTLRIAVSLRLPRRGGLLLHSSGVVEGGRGYVFSGHSGAGKTTTVRLLAPRPPLGDDLVALVPDGDGFQALATPFAGEYGPVAPRSAPLARLYFIEQAPEHRAIPLDAASARAAILRNTLAYVRDPDTASRFLDVAARIAASTPCAKLRFLRDGGVAAALI